MTDGNTNMYMPVAPAYSGGNGGFGFGGDSGAWWLLILLVAMGGWGNGFGFGGGGGALPYIGMTNTNNDVQRGFDQSALMTGITGVNNAVTSGFGNIQTALCNGFAGVNAGIANGFAQSEIADNARQIANMNQSFANQTAVLQGFNGLQNQLSNCCCDNRAATADLKYTVATEACADRSAISNALRDVIAATTAQTQTILDKMCQQEIDSLKSQNIALQNQVNLQALAASQNAQTAALVADNTAQTQYIVNRVAPYPIPAYVVANPVTPPAAAA